MRGWTGKCHAMQLEITCSCHRCVVQVTWRRERRGDPSTDRRPSACIAPNSDLFSRCVVLCFYRAMHFSAKRGIEIAYRPSVCLSVCPSSVTLVDQNNIGWKSWKLIARAISPTPSLFVTQRPSTYSQANMGKFGGY